jgi:hypothetical protein
VDIPGRISNVRFGPILLQKSLNVER